MVFIITAFLILILSSTVEGECSSTASRDNVIADSELVVALQESPVVEELFLQDVHEPVKAVAVRENSKDDITPTVEMAFSLAGPEIAKSEAKEGGNDIDEFVILASRCSAIGASEPVTEMDSSKNNATLPVDRPPSLDLPELTEGEKTSIDKSEITTSTRNVTAASDLVMAEEMFSEDNKRLPMRKRTYMDLRVLTAVVDASEITISKCNVNAASEFTAAEDKVSEATITLPLEHTSSRNVKNSSEVSSTQTSRQNIITGQDVFIAGDEYFKGTTLCKEIVSSVDEADHSVTIVADDTTSKDQKDSAASINDVSAALQVLFAVDRSAEEITLPEEKVSSLDVLKPSEAIGTETTGDLIFMNGIKITASICYPPASWNF